MKITRTARELKTALRPYHRKKLTIGLVATMGALHRGHLSLIRQAKQDNARVVVTLFVNPLQFGPREDFKAYPADIRKDTSRCRKAGADILFIPEARQLLKSEAFRHIRVSYLNKTLCAPFRPGHFNGVATIVALFFRLTQPTRAYFGLKDYQQYRVVAEMTRRNFKNTIEIIPAPIVREASGLAMSSRNRYLKPDERKKARALYRTLQWGRRRLQERSGSARELIKAMKARLEATRAIKVQYIEIVDARTLKRISSLMDTKNRHVLLAAAIHIARTRLIDNVLV